MKAVKIILMVLGGLFGLLIILLVVAFLVGSKTQSSFEGRAEPFINQFLTSQNPWEYEKAKPLLSQLSLESSMDAQNHRLFEFFNNLGPFQSVENITWNSCHTSTHVKRCDYSVNATYENGDALIQFGLSLEEEQIRLIQLNVSSDVFLNAGQSSSQ